MKASPKLQAITGKSRGSSNESKDDENEDNNNPATSTAQSYFTDIAVAYSAARDNTMYSCLLYDSLLLD
jgi:hypothetical protein